MRQGVCVYKRVREGKTQHFFFTFFQSIKDSFLKKGKQKT